MLPALLISVLADGHHCGGRFDHTYSHRPRASLRSRVSKTQLARGSTEAASHWEVRGSTLEHGGHLSCFGSYLYFDTEHQRGVAVLFNANHGERLHALYDIVPNTARLIAGQPLRPPSNDHPYRDKFVQMLALLTVTTTWLVWSLLKVWRWSARTKPLPGGCRFWLFLAAPLVLELAAVGAVYAAVPVKISIAVLHAPDLMMLLGVVVLLLGGWGGIRACWLLALRIRFRQAARRQ